MSQLSQVVRQFARALEMRQQIVVIYFDFSKAFDRVPHEKLLFKLECLGIKGSLLAWFRSYLSGRRHRVMIDNEASDFLPVTSGVSQESIIGPLLFLIYINDRVPGVISEYIIATLRRGALDKSCEIFIFDRCLHGWSSHKISFGLWGREKRELANDHTIFETCILDPFHGQKIKKNLSWTGSREDRS